MCLKQVARQTQIQRYSNARGLPEKGEGASRAHCSDKKQLFEQQLSNRSSFWQKGITRLKN